MRIIAGAYGGRPIAWPRTPATRPMSEKVRGALFNVLGPLEGKQLVDAYAGSGAVGLEALSRGASWVSAIESSPAATKVIRQNLDGLGVDFGYYLSETTVGSYLARLDQSAHFDVAVADPPYDKLEPDVLERLALLLKPAGVMAISHSSKLAAPSLGGLGLLETKRYGDSSLSFYKRA